MLNAASTTMPLPLAQWPRLPRVTDAAARAINMIYGRNQPVGFTCNDGAFRLRWRHCSAAFVPQAMARLDVAGKPGWLALESMAIIPGLNAGDVALLPYPLRGALIMQAFAAALDRLQSLTQKGIHVEVLNEPIQLDDVAQRVYFVLENVQTNLSSWGFVQLEDAASWQTLANACALLTSHPALQWREFATTLRFDIGTTHLTLAESAMLERGDWLLIETARRDANGLECTMRAPGLRYTLRGRIESTQVTILEVNKTMQREDEMPIEASQTDLEALADVELAVSFDMGELACPLAELTAIQPGHVFDLERPIESALVRIRIGGRLVGRGQLVAIGEKLGVRIVEFNAPHK